MIQASSNNATMIFITLQIIVALASSQAFRPGHNGARYPNPLDDIVVSLEFTMLDVFEMIKLDCVVTNPSYELMLQLSTLAPLAVMALAFAGSSLWIACFGGKLMRGPKVTMRLVRQPPRCPLQH